MNLRTLLSLIAILFLAFSLAMLPYVGLPYAPLKVTGLEVAEYELPPSQIHLPVIQK